MRGAGFGDDEVAGMRRQFRMVGTGDASLDEIDEIAKADALGFVKDLLYDVTEGNQFFDAFRLVFPFGDAWAEVLTRWGRLVAENPQLPDRFRQGIRAGRNLDLDGDGVGLFHENDRGEEVFDFPLSVVLMEHAPGGPPRARPVHRTPRGAVVDERDRSWHGPDGADPRRRRADTCSGGGPAVGRGSAISCCRSASSAASRTQPTGRSPGGRNACTTRTIGDDDLSPEQSRIHSNNVKRMLRWMVSNGEIDRTAEGVSAATDEAESRARGGERDAGDDPVRGAVSSDTGLADRR